MNDQQRIAAIRERESKATGDWGFNELEGYIEGLDIFSIDNQRFIAHARADISWLLDQLAGRDVEIERLKQERNNEARRQGDFVEMLDDAGAKLWSFLEDVDASDFQSGEAAGELPRLVEAAIAEIEQLRIENNSYRTSLDGNGRESLETTLARERLTANRVVKRLQVEADQLREHNERLIRGADSAAKIHPSYGPCDGLLEDGGCSECRRVYDQLRQQVAGLEDEAAELRRANEYYEICVCINQDEFERLTEIAGDKLLLADGTPVMRGDKVYKHCILERRVIELEVSKIMTCEGCESIVDRIGCFVKNNLSIINPKHCHSTYEAAAEAAKGE